MRNIKTNSRDLLAALNEEAHGVRWPLSWRLQERARRMFAKLKARDDYDWHSYSIGYRAQFNWTDRFYTLDLHDVDFELISGRLYLLSDCKPLHPTHRCVWEAICNLPKIESIAEIGTGAGYLLINLRLLLGNTVCLSGYDVSEEQLRFFQELWPHEATEVRTAILDLVGGSIPTQERPDVVFASTVLMHIQRPGAYRKALRNFLFSGDQFAVLMDNWRSHNYFEDLEALTRTGSEFEGCGMYFYDSGANIAIVLSLRGAQLSAPYERLATAAVLTKYLDGPFRRA